MGTLGYYRDSASRTYVRARTLNTAQGRWMTQDPIGFQGGDYNLYRYVANRPTVLTDPSGLDTNQGRACNNCSQPQYAMLSCGHYKHDPNDSNCIIADPEIKTVNPKICGKPTRNNNVDYLIVMVPPGKCIGGENCDVDFMWDPNDKQWYRLKGQNTGTWSPPNCASYVPCPGCWLGNFLHPVPTVSPN
ncbi:MAG: hypothetical protein NT023_23355 [Armatimonadetes bacterium]|nr:hypothetical protein [Armatimonadota bacterium]